MPTRGSVNVKLFLIGCLTLMLLVPSAFVGGLIQEREGRRQEAIADVGGKWGAPQTVSGPVLHVPYRRTIKDEKGEARTVVELATFLPATLDVAGAVKTEVRSRGIYDVVLYRAGLTVSGRFDAPRWDDQAVPRADVLWERAFVAIGVSDPRGIEERVTVAWNGVPVAAEAGTAGSTVAANGVHALVPTPGPGGSTFAFDLALRGHDGLSVVPLAARTTVNLRSPWRHPSFGGAFLPREHALSATGFTAAWSILDLNRGFPQHWLGSGPHVDSSAFGVQLLQPVDAYAKSDRAHKYAILIIAMTFVTLFFIETLKEERVHALSYILMGLAICLFYVLLLSLSEHVGFDAAYAIAAVATTALITWHAGAVFTRRSLARAVGAILLSLHGFMFVLLQLQDLALLVGACGLFAMLAGVMAAASRVTSRS